MVDGLYYPSYIGDSNNPMEKSRTKPTSIMDIMEWPKSFESFVLSGTTIRLQSVTSLCAKIGAVQSPKTPGIPGTPRCSSFRAKNLTQEPSIVPKDSDILGMVPMAPPTLAFGPRIPSVF